MFKGINHAVHDDASLFRLARGQQTAADEGRFSPSLKPDSGTMSDERGL
jgi:hypothetical protein